MECDLCMHSMLTTYCISMIYDLCIYEVFTINCASMVYGIISWHDLVSMSYSDAQILEGLDLFS